MAVIRFLDSREPVQVGKILCLGRNYAEHVREMNAEIPEVPVVFIKPATAIIHDGESVVLPAFSHEVHHEVEMVVAIGRAGKNIPRGDAYDYVAGYAVGLDMTLRDIQEEAKKKGLPWSVAKGFDTSAPVSTVVPKAAVPDPHGLDILLAVNGQVRQHANTKSMILRVPDIVAYLSTVFMLEVGDLIFTGTPSGVGKVVHGDVLEAKLDQFGTLRVTIRQQSERGSG